MTIERMSPQPAILDLPVWAALSGAQAKLARGDDRVKRFDANVAPFVALAPNTRVSPAELEPWVAVGEAVTFVGQAPELPASWDVELRADLLQMVARGPMAVRATDPLPEPLASPDVPAMLALTARVFPGYFRAETPRMGTYLGVKVAGELVAMAGERLACGPYREISAVCTHPDHLGRGYARAMIAQLANASFERGLTPFLHVSPDNTGAIRLYESLGFELRATLRLYRARRGGR